MYGLGLAKESMVAQTIRVVTPQKTIVEMPSWEVDSTIPIKNSVIMT